MKRDFLETLGETTTGDARLLLTGWEGTLEPDPAQGQRTPGSTAVVEMSEPLLHEASAALRSLAERPALQVGGAPVPVNGLLWGLQRRVEAVYTMPAAMCAAGAGAAAERMGADRLARAVAEDWISGAELFLERLAADEARLARWMGMAVLPPVVGATAAASDVHGRAGPVMRVELRGGGVVFYKPRAVTGEVLWAELNARVAEVDGESSSPAARALVGAAPGGKDAQAGVSHGWVEGLRAGECEAEVHWRRAGALLCLAQAVGLSDLHMANVLATSSGPAVLDAECLGGAGWLPGVRTGEDGAWMERSLLASGLLPVADGDGAMPDVCGLFGRPAMVPGVVLLCWENDGRELRFRRARLLDQGNRPAGMERPLSYLAGLVQGYRGALRTLLSMRGRLEAKGGWIDRVDAEHAARVVVRGTLEYGVLLSRSLMPESLIDEEARRGMLRSGLCGRPPADGIRVTAEVLQFEVEMLERLHVPRFERARGSRDLLAGEGRVVVSESMARSSGESIRERLETMAADDFADDAASAMAAILFRVGRVAEV